jgi:hypothetical protein
MIGDEFSKNNKLYLGLTFVTIMLYISHLGVIELYAQLMPTMNNTATQQHAEHILDNLIVSEHIIMSVS